MSSDDEKTDVVEEVVIALDEHDAKIAEQEAAVKRIQDGKKEEVKEECTQ